MVAFRRFECRAATNLPRALPENHVEREREDECVNGRKWIQLRTQNKINPMLHIPNYVRREETPSITHHLVYGDVVAILVAKLCSFIACTLHLRARIGLIYKDKRKSEKVRKRERGL